MGAGYGARPLVITCKLPWAVGVVQPVGKGMLVWVVGLRWAKVSERALDPEHLG